MQRASKHILTAEREVRLHATGHYRCGKTAGIERIRAIQRCFAVLFSCSTVSDTSAVTDVKHRCLSRSTHWPSTYRMTRGKLKLCLGLRAIVLMPTRLSGFSSIANGPSKNDHHRWVALMDKMHAAASSPSIRDREKNATDVRDIGALAYQRTIFDPNKDAFPVGNRDNATSSILDQLQVSNGCDSTWIIEQMYNASLEWRDFVSSASLSTGCNHEINCTNRKSSCARRKAHTEGRINLIC